MLQSASSLEAYAHTYEEGGRPTTHEQGPRAELAGQWSQDSGVPCMREKVMSTQVKEGGRWVVSCSRLLQQVLLLFQLLLLSALFKSRRPISGPRQVVQGLICARRYPRARLRRRPRRDQWVTKQRRA